MAKNILVTLSLDTSDAVKGAQAGTASVGELTSAIADLQATAKNRESLKELGVAMQDATEASHQFRSGVDDVVEQLNVFGDAGSELVAEINKIPDPMKRIEVAQRLMANQSSITGGAVQRFSTALTVGKLRLAGMVGGMGNLNLLLGGLGAAAGLAGVAVGGLASAVNKYIESNEQAKRRSKELTDSWDGLVVAAGELVFKLPVVQEGISYLTKEFTELRREIDGTTEAKRKFVEEGVKKETGSTTQERSLKYKSKLKPGEDPLLALAYGQLDNQEIEQKYAAEFEQKLAADKKATERRKKLLEALSPEQKEYIQLYGKDLITKELHTKEMERLLREEGKSVDSVERLTQLRELGLVSVSEAQKHLRRLTAKTNEESAKVKSAIEAARTRTGFDWRYGAGSQAEGAASREAEGLTSFVPGRAAPENGYADPRLGPGLRQADDYVQQLRERMNATRQNALLEIETANSKSRVLSSLNEIERQQEQDRIDRIARVTQAWAGAAASFVENSARIGVALAGQGGAWRAWQQSGLQAISGLASSFGDFFIVWGSAQAAINPATAALAIAGGIALKGVAGAVGGAADRLGDRDKKATTAARVQAPTVSGRDQGGDTTIVLEMDGNRLAHTVSPYLSRAARNGILTLRPST